LRAIQSLIMTTKPYHNEPGYEETSSEYGKPEEVVAYGEKIQHENLRICVCGVLEDCLSNTKQPAFSEIIKNHFLRYYDAHINRVEKEKAKDGTKFQMMSFEYPENGCAGSFNYASIANRLGDIKGKIERETQLWKERGHELTKSESGWKHYRLIEEISSINKGGHLEDGISAGPVSQDNIYLWHASIFGSQDTPWEGGIYNVEIVFNDKDEPPRVKFLSEIWHPNVSRDGYPLFVVSANSKEPVRPILHALKKLLENEPNSSSATWINPIAAAQYFSKEDAPKLEYRRKVSQCVRRSMDG